MLPIRNITSSIAAFAGRSLDGSNPKYLNSAESAVFHKGYTLFNIDKAKDAMKHNKQALIVEGYFDVMRLYKNGFKNVAAPMGTALTADQISLLKRYAEEITVMFDGDSAGEKAAFRSLERFAETSLFPKVIFLPKEDDPDSFVLNYGIDALKSFEFLIPVYITEYGDVFGNYDDHTIESVNKDKIIIVQKLNIVDYINFYCPELFDISESDKQISEGYEDLMVMLNIFIVIECLSIISYAVLFIGYYNHTILIDEMSDKLNPIKEKIEDLFDKDDDDNESPK